jgi:hypothetical protein
MFRRARSDGDAPVYLGSDATSDRLTNWPQVDTEQLLRTL